MIRNNLPFHYYIFFYYSDDTAILLEIDYTNVEPEDMKAAQVLFETVGEVLGRSARGALSVHAGFYELGGNSLNSIYTITRLRDQGYHIGKCFFLLGPAQKCSKLCRQSTIYR